MRELGEFEVALGTEVFDPADAEPLRRRSIGERPDGDPDPNDTRLVQFHAPLSGPDQDRLKVDYGLALTAYVPNLAYVERVDQATRGRLARDPLVRVVAPYRPEYKFSAHLVERRDAGTLSEVRVIASLFDGGSLDLVTAALTAAGATDVVPSDGRRFGSLPRITFLTDDGAVLDKAAAIPDVRFLEPVGEIVLTDVRAASKIQSGDPATAVIWDRGIHGEGQIIGHMEPNSADDAHCFFADIPNTPGPLHRKIVAIHNPAVSTTSHEGLHSTFTAGCVAGDERGNDGAHPNRGSAWAAKLVLNSTPPPAAIGTLLARLEQNRGSGAVIHTNSWILPTSLPATYDPWSEDVDRFCHLHEDNIVIGATGNDFPDGIPQGMGAPGSAKNALSICCASEDGTTITSCTPGPTADDRRKPEVAAVGSRVKGPRAGPCVVEPWPTRPGFDDEPATSWATPHAAGAAALVRQYFMEGWYPTGSKTREHGFAPSGALIRAVLVNSTVDVTGVPGFPSAREGWGVIHIDRALTFASNGRNLVPRDIRNAFGLRTGEEWTQDYTVTAPLPGQPAQQLKAVLAYTDPPGTSGVPGASLVNNLNLEVTDPDGVKYVGNDFNTGAGLSNPNSTSTGDDLNPVEVVLVAAPKAGTWRATIKGKNVRQDRQGFALVITSSAPPPKDGCFVATTVYGDPWHPDVVALRTWRDDALAAGGIRGTAMSAVAAVYGVVGPWAARGVDRSPRVAAALRARVFPVLVARITRRGG